MSLDNLRLDRYCERMNFVSHREETRILFLVLRIVLKTPEGIEEIFGELTE